jgi:outer membrane biosynthesis protein TonB
MNTGNKGVTIGGDGNAIDGIEVTDARSYRDSHDSSYQDSHNVTNIYNGTAADEKSLADRKNAYKAFCQQTIKNGLISRTVREQLNDRARELNLDSVAAQEIEQSVKKRSVSSQTLDSSAQWSLDEVKRGISEDSNEMKRLIPDLLELAERVDTDEVQCEVYLVLAAENPSQLATLYRNKSYDNYWMSFWAFMAFKRMGNAKDASKVMTELSRWDNSDANLGLLKCADKLYDYFASNADESVLAWAYENLEQFQSKSYLLDGFFMAILYMLKNPSRPLKLTSSAECNYYLRLFGVRDQSARLLDIPRPRPVAVPQTQPQVAGMSEEVAREIDRRVRSAEASLARPVVEEKKSNKKWIYGCIAAAVVLFFLFGRGKKETPVEETQEPVVEEVVETPAETTTQNSKKSSKTKSKESTVSSTKQETAPAKSTTTAVTTTPSSTSMVAANSLESATTATTPTTTTASTTSNSMSAAELVSQGRSALKRFQDTKALGYFSEAAQKGSVEAYRYIGDIFYNGGNNTSRDFSKAFAAYSRAAAGNNAEAQYMLGVMYRNGQGCDKNIGLAKVWLGKAAAQGHVKAAQALERI